MVFAFNLVCAYYPTEKIYLVTDEWLMEYIIYIIYYILSYFGIKETRCTAK